MHTVVLQELFFPRRKNIPSSPIDETTSCMQLVVVLPPAEKSNYSALYKPCLLKQLSGFGGTSGWPIRRQISPREQHAASLIHLSRRMVIAAAS